MPIKKEIIIGNCRLILGDCLEVMPLLNKIDVVVTDPPYEGVFNGGGIARLRPVYKKISDAKLDVGFNVEVFKNIADSLTFFCAKSQITKIINFAEKEKYRWNLTTFNKTNPPPLCNGNYLPDTEYIFHLWKNCKLGGTIKDRSRFWTGSCGSVGGKHPTIKPVDLMIKLIKCSRQEVPITVLDPFMGSGTTGVACIKTGYKFIGIEINETYFEIACERIKAVYMQPNMLNEKQEEITLKQESIL